MDADDISVNDRFEQELEILLSSGADIVGGDIAEFIGSTENVIGYRKVPCVDSEIKKYMKKRCPFNQMTVMFRKTLYINAGGYLDWYCDEDYYLWIRMMLSGAEFVKTGSVLVYARVGEEMYLRRGGVKYFVSEARLQKLMWKKNLISTNRFVINVFERFIFQVIMSHKMRGYIFKLFVRSK